MLILFLSLSYGFFSQPMAVNQDQDNKTMGSDRSLSNFGYNRPGSSNVCENRSSSAYKEAVNPLNCLAGTANKPERAARHVLPMSGFHQSEVNCCY